MLVFTGTKTVKDRCCFSLEYLLGSKDNILFCSIVWISPKIAHSTFQ